MAGVAGANSSLNKALMSFLSEWKANNSASLTLKSVRGELSVTLKLKLGHHGEKPEASRGYQNLQRTQVGPSQLRRRERRAADPLVQQKAAEYAAASALPPANPAEQAVAVTAGQAKAEEAPSAEEAVPAAGQAAAGQASVPSDLGVECPQCESEFVATKIFSHLIESHGV